MSSPSLPPKIEPELWRALHEIKVARLYRKGVRLFEHGEDVSGVYVIEFGGVGILLPTAQDQVQLLKVAGPGALLGLSESMSGDRHRVTAEAHSDATIGFIARQNFVEFLATHNDFCMQMVRLLSEDLHGLYHKFRNISSHAGRPRQRTRDEQCN